MQNTIDATTFLKTKLRDRTAYEGTFFFPPPAKRYDTTLYNTSIEIIKFRYVRILRSQINSHLFSSNKNTTRAFLLKKKKREKSAMEQHEENLDKQSCISP